MDDRTKRKRVTALQRYVLNPPAKLAVWAGLVPGYALIETTGRRSGKQRHNVVGIKIDGNNAWIVAEQGRHAGYVHNLEADPRVRLRVGRRWRRAQATVLMDDDASARLDSFGRQTHAATLRRFGTDLATVRVDFSSS